jgi:hypothetical protein
VNTDWAAWQASLMVEPGEDLSKTFNYVRGTKKAATRADWANDPRTRGFCDLGLHYVYVHNVAEVLPRTGDDDLRLFRFPTAETLFNHAQLVIPDESAARVFTTTRFTDTWGNVGRYTSDLIAYLFRPNSYLGRIREARTQMLQVATVSTLGEFVRLAADAQTQQVVANPLASLQTFVQATHPANPNIRMYVQRLEDEALELWSELYEVIFTGYGLELRPGTTWRDIAELFTTLAEGAILRHRSYDEPPELSNGLRLLSAGVLAMLPSLLDTSVENLQARLWRAPPTE